MSVSKQLIHLRNVKGISQEELASLMNVTRQAVSKWETDQALPDSE
ncbi:MAG: helix-turn-helix transcriptional regulator, partial [Coprobacillus cateniformis]|nr:helix-turn-helix transcriptional regulator [Coprobacillus cateniformis]